jgi:hypothetical protein
MAIVIAFEALPRDSNGIIPYVSNQNAPKANSYITRVGPVFLKIFSQIDDFQSKYLDPTSTEGQSGGHLLGVDYTAPKKTSA